ncbi:MAG: flagellar hook assembly protein FlgD [Phycisphaerae bacterium]
MSDITGMGQSASKIQADYLKLLVTQLQHQNPLEPMDNNQMASQLAQLSSLEQLENLNSRFAAVLDFQTKTAGADIIGKQVNYLLPGTDEVRTGTVSACDLSGGEMKLQVGEHQITFNDIEVIREKAQ